MSLLDIAKARKELVKTSMVQIERTTGITWGGRAAASYQLCLEGRDLAARFRHFYEGENYRQEALEHSAMVEDRGELLRQVHDEIEPIRQEAMATLEDLAAPRRKATSPRRPVKSNAGKPARSRPKTSVSDGKSKP